MVTSLSAAMHQFGGLHEPKMAEGLAEAGVDGAIAGMVVTAFEARRGEIRQALLAETRSIANAQLEDFDWNIKMAVASDFLADLQEPMLHLSLKVRNPDSTVEDVKIELSHAELQGVIGKMEAANTVVRELKHVAA